VARSDVVGLKDISLRFPLQVLDRSRQLRVAFVIADVQAAAYRAFIMFDRGDQCSRTHRFYRRQRRVDDDFGRVMSVGRCDRGVITVGRSAR
jgi:hypothetical protein